MENIIEKAIETSNNTLFKYSLPIIKWINICIENNGENIIRCKNGVVLLNHNISFSLHRHLKIQDIIDYLEKYLESFYKTNVKITYEKKIRGTPSLLGSDIKATIKKLSIKITKKTN